MKALFERFQALLENSPVALSVISAEGYVLYATPPTARILGYEPTNLIGRSSMELLHPSDRDLCAEAFRTILAQPQSCNRFQARVLRADGHWKWVEVLVSSFLDQPALNACIVSYRDIAEGRADEKEKRIVAEELLRSNIRLTAFAYTVAHDLQEPLRTICAHTQLLVRKAQLADSDKEIGAFITEGVHRMSALVEHLLSSATRDIGDSLQQLRLDRAANQALQNLAEAIRSSGAVVSVDPLPVVQANECDLVRLFQNLIGNAIKYRSAAPPKIRVAAERCGPDWLVRISDNGIGISPEHHRRVFGLLTRVHGEDVRGAGLGLAVCRQIVEGLGGSIWVESVPGVGSTFCFTIPAEAALKNAASFKADAQGEFQAQPQFSAGAAATL